MTHKATIDSDLKVALLAGDKLRADTLRGLKAAILNDEVAQGKRDEGLDDEAVEKLIAREVKKRAESATVYDEAGRPELAQQERAESDIIAVYLPAQASEADIQKVIDATIASLPEVTPAVMGQVIGAVKGRFGTTADGAVIARLVKEALGN